MSYIVIISILRSSPARSLAENKNINNVIVLTLNASKIIMHIFFRSSINIRHFSCIFACGHEGDSPNNVQQITNKLTCVCT